MEDSTLNTIEFWKRHSPRPEEQIPFRSIMKGLGTQFSTLEFREEVVGRWGVKFHKRNSPEVAVFTFAGVVSQADDMETGNLVPEGQMMQEHSSWRKPQRKANSWCFYTIILDTSSDNELFELLKNVDEFVENSPTGFGNSLTRVRRSFMSGRDARYMGKFWMQTPMFLPISSGPKPSPPKHLHRWVVQADVASTLFRANPSRPALYGRRGSTPIPLRECDPNHLCAGDVVSIAFHIVYYTTDKEWYPQYQPVEVFVLKRSALADIKAYDAAYVDRPPPTSMSLGETDDCHARSSPDNQNVIGGEEKGREAKLGAEGSGDDEDLYASPPRDAIETSAIGSASTTGNSSLPDECESPSASQPRAGYGMSGDADAVQQKTVVEDDVEKSSTSTISDGNEAKGTGSGDHSGRSHAAGKKRAPARQVEGDEHDGGDGNQDVKRKGRKALRLG